MKAVNIKWDVTDADRKMTGDEIKEILETLPTEIDIPDCIEVDDEISDYISDLVGFCHYGFELVD